MSKKKRCHSERTRLGRRQDVAKSCFNCEHFLYCGDGDHVCDLETSAGAIVQPLIDEWDPTEHFFIAVERNGGVDMPIKNYTTKIDVFESLGEIQGALARNGARKIMVDYDDRGRPVGITFGLQTAQGGMLFQLPANTPGVMAAFERQKIRPDVEQAERTAWRNIRDWILAQMAFVEAGNVHVDEVFLPYMTDGKGRTLYQAYQHGQLMLGDGQRREGSQCEK